MPYLEYPNRPEWTNRYSKYCVVLTLESMLSFITGHAVVAPESVYKLRQKQIDNGLRSLEADINQEYPYLISLLSGDLAGRENAIRMYRYQLVSKDRDLIIKAILPTWIESDQDLGEIIGKLQFHFVDEPYQELEKAVRNHYPVGVAVASLGLIPGIGTHMFHLAPCASSDKCHDVSDLNDQIRNAINDSITDKSMSDVIEITRAQCGMSALIISG